MLDDVRDTADLDEIDQDEARSMLQQFCDNGFDGLPDMAALALGRTEEDIHAMLDGSEVIDEDLLMKIRGIAEEREIPLDA